MGKRAKAKKDGIRKPQNGNTRNARKKDGIFQTVTGLPKSKNAGKKARAQERAMLTAQLDGSGAGFAGAYSASQKKKASRGFFAY